MLLLQGKRSRKKFLLCLLPRIGSKLPNRYANRRTHREYEQLPKRKKRINRLCRNDKILRLLVFCVLESVETILASLL
jgi:hypothetical protein